MSRMFSINRVTLILALFFITGIALCACSSPSGGDDKKANQGARSASEVPTVPVVKVESRILNSSFELPGQLVAFRDVQIHAKVKGYVSKIYVDRGSIVKQGQILMDITAPELDAQVREAGSKVEAAHGSLHEAESKLEGFRSNQVEAEAKLEADSLTYKRLQIAAKTPGAVAQNEVDIAQKTAEADKARVQAMKNQVAAGQALVAAEGDNLLAAQHNLRAVEDMRQYLTIRAPFDGVITERDCHEGSMVATEQGRESRTMPLVRIQERAHLRLVVSVPEVAVAGVKEGLPITFTVPAYLGKTFTGKVARLGYALDLATRTMPVELDVFNADGRLEPGMFATVLWHSQRSYPTMFLPSSAVGETLERTYVVKVLDGKAVVVDVQRGQPMGDLVEVVGDLKSGDEVLLKATDEYKTGTRLIAKAATESDLNAALHKTVSAGGE